MKFNQRVVGIGNVVCDMYYQDNQLIGISGGQTTSNILFNLAVMGVRTKLIGSVGDDIYGEIATDSLSRVKVNLSGVKVLKQATTTWHISVINNKGINSRKCPYCALKRKYVLQYEHIKDALSGINDNDIIIIDQLNDVTLAVIEQYSNKSFFDFGYPDILIDITKKELIKMISNKFEIINMNNVVFEYIQDKFNLSELELAKLLNIKLLIVTKGKAGADFIFDDKLISKMAAPVTEIENNGAVICFVQLSSNII